MLGGNLTTSPLMGAEGCMEIFTQTPYTCVVAMTVERTHKEGGLAPDGIESWTSPECLEQRAMREWTTQGVLGGPIALMKNVENPLLIFTFHNPRPLTFHLKDPMDLDFQQVYT